MLDKIISIYNEQLIKYNSIIDILSNFDTNDSNLDITQYLKELEYVDKTIALVKEMNNSLEILKEKYVVENGLKDFLGEEIKKIESADKYDEFKNLLNNLTNIIADVKKMQDRIISNIKNQMDITKTLLQEVNNSKRAVLSYKRLEDSDKTKYINKKK